MEDVGGDAKQLEWVLIKLTHASGNACIPDAAMRWEMHAFTNAAPIPQPLTDQRRKSGLLWTWQYVHRRASLSKHQSK
jgi:hypothetical protein